MEGEVETREDERRKGETDGLFFDHSRFYLLVDGLNLLFLWGRPK